MLLRDQMLLRLLGCAVLLTGVAWPSAVGRASPAPARPYTHASGAPRTATKKAIPGWPGAAAQYLGRYRLTKSSDPALATGGGLTIFLRKVPHFTKPLLSGILSLNAKHQANVVYLTKFMHAGTSLWTTVNLGIYTGPAFSTNPHP
jgi:hypothetical protein